MSSVQGSKPCPKCGGIMVYDFDCRTTEEERRCTRCGFYQNWFLLRNEDGSVKTKEDGSWLGDYEEKIGYGVVDLMPKNGLGYRYLLFQPLSEEEKAEVLKDFQNPEIDESSSYAVLYDPQSNTFTVLVGRLPEAYPVDCNESGGQENAACDACMISETTVLPETKEMEEHAQ